MFADPGLALGAVAAGQLAAGCCYGAVANDKARRRLVSEAAHGGKGRGIEEFARVGRRRHEAVRAGFARWGRIPAAVGRRARAKKPHVCHTRRARRLRSGAGAGVAGLARPSDGIPGAPLASSTPAPLAAADAAHMRCC